MKLSVIIVAYNAESFLAVCLRSLEKHLARIEHEVCVVDNASMDGSDQLVEREFPKVKLIRAAHNLGFAAGINLGLRNTNGEFVLWLNPDAELRNEGIADLFRYLRSQPEVGVIGPDVRNPDGSSQLSCRAFPSYETAIFNRESLMTRWRPDNQYSVTYLMMDMDRKAITEVDWVSGACLLHRRQLISSMGGLDERFFMYCEDVDFCLRARRAGWKIVYHPGLRVRHHSGSSARAVKPRMLIEHHRSMWRYYTKHFRRAPIKDSIVAAAIGCRLIIKLVASMVTGQ